ncbi:hypothetical protein GCM10027413_23920 [Conyzicola nivalis]|uniref:Uncharacterized protein n=1 Tax=Conyzicola nivalis TaxID=1477021 RepID=A0A916SB80_9MICO|nr:hypothetical protein [Conyzicola nivalis]GGA91474.1 hypothetical protein GCM10010979_02700 [Conyzicola nivalis]
MSYPPASENTLGLLAEVRASRSIVGGARRLVRPDNPHRASLGTAFIGIGAALVCAISAIYGFSWFVAYWPDYPNPVAAIGAWVLLVVVLVLAFITASVVGDRLPDWMFAVFLALLGVVIVLDILAIWDLHDVGRYATASLTAATALLLVITLRRPSDIFIATGVIGASLLVVMIVNTELSPDNAAAQLTSLAFAVLPVVIGVMIVRGFRSMVQVELDRVLVQSTVSAPRFAVGMLASEELARLDLAAEELLDSVATGRIALPLRPKTASVAASLATELRLHLIEGRRETWLYHAITESELLGRSVTLTDKGSLAGLLDANQRDGLLAAVWLLVNDHAKKTAVRTVQVSIGPIVATSPVAPSHKLKVPVVITTTGVQRNRVDPSTWDAIRRVGRYSDSSQNASLRVEIECFVDNPADL